MPAAPGRPRRVDYEYERAGTANLFLFTEPQTGWRQVTATARRTKVDWAVEIRTLLDGRYAEADKVVLVLDNLNTYTRGAFSEAFPPAEARRLAERGHHGLPGPEKDAAPGAVRRAAKGPRGVPFWPWSITQAA